MNFLVLSQKGEAAPLFYRDVPLQGWRVWTYDYTGQTRPGGFHHSLASRGGGESQAHCMKLALDEEWDYFGHLPHDVEIRASDISRMARAAKKLDLAAFAASQTHDSHQTYDHMLHRPSRFWHEVPFVEDQCAFFARDIVEHLLPYYEDCFSGCGVTHYALPWILEQHGRGRKVGVFDFCQSWHADPSNTAKAPWWREQITRVYDRVERERHACTST